MNSIKSAYEKIKKRIQEKPTQTILALAVSAIFIRTIIKNKLVNVKLSYFLQALSQNLISEVVISGTTLKFRPQDSNTWYSTNSELLTRERLYKLLHEKENITFSCEPQLDQSQKELPVQIIFGLFGMALSYKMYKNMMDKNYNPKNAQNLHKEKLRFNDIAGLDPAKKKLKEIINYLNQPEKYQRVGARLRKGVLLYGPPGTGKTMLAKATAGESNSSFLYTTASEFVEMYVGVGAKRIRQLFKTAREQAPCIIFIDEIDGLGFKRSTGQNNENGSHQERENTLNQLLTEMDGFSESQNIVVIAATNREQLLDSALIRSGRFDTKIKITLPIETCRHEILQIHTKDKQHSIDDEMLLKIAKSTEGFSGADLEAIVNESAYVCIDDERQTITSQDMEKAFQKFFEEKFNFAFNKKQINLQQQQ